MTVVIGHPKIMWGAGNEKPLLPVGYHYIEKYRQWLLAQGPTGRRYYVSDDALWRQVTTPLGTLGLDDRETIELPQRQLQ